MQQIQNSRFPRKISQIIFLQAWLFSMQACLFSMQYRSLKVDSKCKMRNCPGYLLEETALLNVVQGMMVRGKNPKNYRCKEQILFLPYCICLTNYLKKNYFCPREVLRTFHGDHSDFHT